MALRPIDDALGGDASVAPVRVPAVGFAVADTAGDMTAEARVGDADVACILLHQLRVVIVAAGACGVIEDLAVVIHTEARDLWPEAASLGGQTDVFRRVPANAGNTRALETLCHLRPFIDNILILGVQVGHTDILMGNVIAVVPVVAGALVMEVRAVSPTAGDAVAPCAVIPTRKVVRDDVDDDLDAVFLCFRA